MLGEGERAGRHDRRLPRERDKDAGERRRKDDKQVARRIQNGGKPQIGAEEKGHPRQIAKQRVAQGSGKRPKTEKKKESEEERPRSGADEPGRDKGRRNE